MCLSHYQWSYYNIYYYTSIVLQYSPRVKMFSAEKETLRSVKKKITFCKSMNCSPPRLYQSELTSRIIEKSDQIKRFLDFTPFCLFSIQPLLRSIRISLKGLFFEDQYQRQSVLEMSISGQGYFPVIPLFQFRWY